MLRRDFLKVVGGVGVVAVAPSLIEGRLYAEDGTLYTSYKKVQLSDAEGKPLLASQLDKEVNYVFNYPYAGTSCMLIALPHPTEKNVKLTSEDGVQYIWKGGVGKERNIVAFSSICPHQLTHINKSDTFISYLKTGGKTMGCTKSMPCHDKGEVIVCGSHLSVYDPKKGAKVLGGPAPQPLASIVLEHHDDDTLWAVGVLGPDKFHEFFRAFKPELKEQYGGKRKAKKLVKDKAPTVTLAEFTKDIIRY
ncbi:Rieske 2Fe-2S domain-containing protein [Sulfurimonas hydrogeniphila]|uniref:Rieske 2Fe-2S domain-containing protein n=1 Tax=Sulfurimonas hydrogeniphila TaxID=2509341 RepID=UPI00125EDF16|nr:Rieske 2Fe-2S domain-containing protein [Sulfurimonas hydrogeniphila]